MHNPSLKRVLALWLLLTALLIALSHVGASTVQDASDMPGVCCSQVIQDLAETDPLLPEEVPAAALMPAPRTIHVHTSERLTNLSHPPLLRPPRA